MYNLQAESARIELLKVLCTLEQEQLHDFLINFLVDYYKPNEITNDDSFIWCNGEIPVLLVAHLDTVHKQKPTTNDIFHDQFKNVLWSPYGIGGDDRCGVFIIICLIMQGFKPSICFVHDEEIGCIGSGYMVQNFLPINVYEINFAIQFDRRNHAEAVYYQLDNMQFEDYITSFGFDTKIGSYTDICEICPTYGFAGVNLSAGYINEHKTNEMILLDTVFDTMRKAEKILNDQIENPSFFEYRAISYNWKTTTQTEYSNYYEDFYYMEEKPKTKKKKSTFFSW